MASNQLETDCRTITAITSATIKDEAILNFSPQLYGQSKFRLPPYLALEISQISSEINMSRFEYLDLAASSSAIGKISSASPFILVASAKDLLAPAAQLQVVLGEVTRLSLLLTTRDTA